MTETIKPCAYCGEPEKLEVIPIATDFRVQCLSCYALGPTSRTKVNAILLWNAAANALEAAKAERDEGIEHLKFTLDQRNELDGKLILCEENLANVRAERDMLLDERNEAVAQCAEARTIARKLWREKEKQKYWCKEIKFDEKAVTEALEKVYGPPRKFGGIVRLTKEEWDALVDVRKGTPGFPDD